MKNYVIYQAHSRPSLYHEVLYSIYSFGVHHALNDYHFLIYTDNPDSFRPYLDHIPHTIHDLNKDKVRDWMGEIRFVHRVKIKLLQEVLQQYEGSFLYVDSDTYFTGSVKEYFANIASGRLLMHICEGETGTLKMYRKLVNHTSKLSSGDYPIDRHVAVWNAGALGFTNRSEHLFGKVLEMTDDIQTWYPKHISEQFAFSYFFQPEKGKDAMDAKIHHYWILKEFQQRLADIFEHSPTPSDLTRIVKQHSPISDSLRKQKWRSHSGLYRAFQRWMGRDFKIDELKSEGLLEK